MGITTIPAILGIALHYRAEICGIGAKLLQWFISLGIIRGLPNGIFSNIISSPINLFSKALPNSLNLVDKSLSAFNLLSKVEAPNTNLIWLVLISSIVVLSIILVAGIIYWLTKSRKESKSQIDDYDSNKDVLGGQDPIQREGLLSKQPKQGTHAWYRDIVKGKIITQKRKEAERRVYSNIDGGRYIHLWTDRDRGVYKRKLNVGKDFEEVMSVWINNIPEEHRRFELIRIKGASSIDNPRHYDTGIGRYFYDCNTGNIHTANMELVERANSYFTGKSSKEATDPIVVFSYRGNEILISDIDGVKSILYTRHHQEKELLIVFGEDDKGRPSITVYLLNSLMRPYAKLREGYFDKKDKVVIWEEPYEPLGISYLSKKEKEGVEEILWCLGYISAPGFIVDFLKYILKNSDRFSSLKDSKHSILYHLAKVLKGKGEFSIENLIASLSLDNPIRKLKEDIAKFAKQPLINPEYKEPDEWKSLEGLSDKDILEKTGIISVIEECFSSQKSLDEVALLCQKALFAEVIRFTDGSFGHIGKILGINSYYTKELAKVYKIDYTDRRWIIGGANEIIGKNLWIPQGGISMQRFIEAIENIYTYRVLERNDWDQERAKKWLKLEGNLWRFNHILEKLGIKPDESTPRIYGEDTFNRHLKAFMNYDRNPFGYDIEQAKRYFRNIFRGKKAIKLAQMLDRQHAELETVYKNIVLIRILTILGKKERELVQKYINIPYSCVIQDEYNEAVNGFWRSLGVSTDEETITIKERPNDIFDLENEAMRKSSDMIAEAKIGNEKFLEFANEIIGILNELESKDLLSSAFLQGVKNKFKAASAFFYSYYEQQKKKIPPNSRNQIDKTRRRFDELRKRKDVAQALIANLIPETNIYLKVLGWFLIKVPFMFAILPHELTHDLYAKIAGIELEKVDIFKDVIPKEIQPRGPPSPWFYLASTITNIVIIIISSILVNSLGHIPYLTPFLNYLIFINATTAAIEVSGYIFFRDGDITKAIEARHRSNLRKEPAQSEIGTKVIKPYISELIESKKKFIVVTSPEEIEQMKQWDFPHKEKLLEKAIQVGDVHQRYFDKWYKEAKRKEEKAEVIIGIGMGSVMDWAKIIGYKFGVDVILIPSAISTNAMWTSIGVIRKGEGNRFSVYDKLVGAPQNVLIDLDFIRLNKLGNIAGAGDLLSSWTALKDWDLAIAYGKEEEVPYLYRRTRELLAELDKHAEDIRNNTPEGLKVAAEIGREISHLTAEFGSVRPKAGSEHILAYAIEKATQGKKILHGELVAIATLLMWYFFYSKSPSGITPADFRDKVAALGLPLDLAKIGLTRQDLIRALCSVGPVKDRFTFFDVYKISQEEAQDAVDTLFGKSANLYKPSGVDTKALPEGETRQKVDSRFKIRIPGMVKGWGWAGLSMLLFSGGWVMSKYILKKYITEGISPGLRICLSSRYMLTLAVFATFWLLVYHLANYLKNRIVNETQESFWNAIFPDIKLIIRLYKEAKDDLKSILKGATCAHIISGITYYIGLSLLSTKLATFVFQATLIFKFILGVKILKEEITKNKIIGSGMVVSGVLTIIGISKGSADMTTLGFIVGILAMLGCSIVSAYQHVLYKGFFDRHPEERLKVVKFGYLLAIIPISAFIFVLQQIVGVSGFPIMWHRLIFFGTSIIFPLAFYFQFKALGTKGFDATHLAPIMASATIVTTLLEGKFLHNWPQHPILFGLMCPLVILGAYKATSKKKVEERVSNSQKPTPLGFISWPWKHWINKGKIRLETAARWSFTLEEGFFSGFLLNFWPWFLAVLGFLDPSHLIWFYLASSILSGISHTSRFHWQEDGKLQEIKFKGFKDRIIWIPVFMGMGAMFRSAYLIPGLGPILGPIIAFGLHALWNNVITRYIMILPLGLGNGIDEKDADYQKKMEDGYLFMKRYYISNKYAQLTKLLEKERLDTQAIRIFLIFYLVYYLKTQVSHLYHEEFFRYFEIPRIDKKFFLKLTKIKDDREILYIICEDEGASKRKDELAGLILKRETGLLDRLGLSQDSIRKKQKELSRISRREYELMYGDADKRRRELLWRYFQFCNFYNKKISPKYLKPKFFILALTYLCGKNCRHCQLVYRKSQNQADDSTTQNQRWLRYLDITKTMGINEIALTGGEIIKWAREELLFIIKNAVHADFIQFNTNASFAYSIEAAKEVLDEVWQARMNRPSDAQNLKLQICISPDWFHQEVLASSDGTLYERVPLKNVANLIQAIIEYYPDINILIASNLNPNQMNLLSSLKDELESRGYSFNLYANEFVPQRVEEFGSLQGELYKEGALRDARIVFFKMEGDQIQQVNVVAAIFFDYINAIGWSELLDSFEFGYIEGLTEAYFNGRVKLSTSPQQESIVIDRDGNVNFENNLYLRNWAVSNLERDSLENISTLINIDPLLYLGDDYINEFVDIAAEVLEEEVLQKIKIAPNPVIVRYRLLRSPAMRLYITQCYFQKKYQGDENALTLLGLDRDIESLKAEYRELMKQEPDRSILLGGKTLSSPIKGKPANENGYSIGFISWPWKHWIDKGKIRLETAARWSFTVEEGFFAGFLLNFLPWFLAVLGFLDPSHFIWFYIVSNILSGISHTSRFHWQEDGTLKEIKLTRLKDKIIWKTVFALYGFGFRWGYLIPGLGPILGPIIAFTFHAFWNNVITRHFRFLPLGMAKGNSDVTPGRIKIQKIVLGKGIEGSTPSVSKTLEDLPEVLYCLAQSYGDIHHPGVRVCAPRRGFSNLILFGSKLELKIDEDIYNKLRENIRARLKAVKSGVVVSETGLPLYLEIEDNGNLIISDVDYAERRDMKNPPAQDEVEEKKPDTNPKKDVKKIRFPLTPEFIRGLEPEEVKCKVKTNSLIFHLGEVIDAPVNLDVTDMLKKKICASFKLGEVNIACLEFKDSDNTYAFGIMLGDNIIGHGFVSYIPGERAVRFRFGINNKLRRKGYGSQALAFLMAMAIKGKIFDRVPVDYFGLSEPSPERAPAGMEDFKSFLRKAGFDKNYRFYMDSARKGPRIDHHIQGTIGLEFLYRLRDGFVWVWRVLTEGKKKPILLSGNLGENLKPSYSSMKDFADNHLVGPMPDGTFQTVKAIIEKELPGARFALKTIRKIKAWMDENEASDRPLIIWQNMRLGEMYPYFTEKMKQKLGIIDISGEPLDRFSKSGISLPEKLKNARYILVKEQLRSSFPDEIGYEAHQWDSTIATGVVEKIRDFAERLSAPVVMIDHGYSSNMKSQNLLISHEEIRNRRVLKINAKANNDWQRETGMLKQNTFFIVLNANPHPDELGSASYFDYDDNSVFLNRSGAPEVVISGKTCNLCDIARKVFGQAIEKEMERERDTTSTSREKSVYRDLVKNLSCGLPFIRAGAAERLGNYPKALKLLQQSFDREEISDIRRTIIRSIVNISMGMRKRKRGALIPWYQGIIYRSFDQGKDFATAQEAIIALGRLRIPEAFAALKEIFNKLDAQESIMQEKENREEMMRITIVAMGINRHSEAEGFLISLLSDQDTVKRRAAAQALGYFKNENVVDILEGARKDEDPEVRFYAQRSLIIIFKRANQAIEKIRQDHPGTDILEIIEYFKKRRVKGWWKVVERILTKEGDYGTGYEGLLFQLKAAKEIEDNIRSARVIAFEHPAKHEKGKIDFILAVSSIENPRKQPGSSVIDDGVYPCETKWLQKGRSSGYYKILSKNKSKRQLITQMMQGADISIKSPIKGMIFVVSGPKISATRFKKFTLRRAPRQYGGFGRLGLSVYEVSIPHAPIFEDTPSPLPVASRTSINVGFVIRLFLAGAIGVLVLGGCASGFNTSAPTGLLGEGLQFIAKLGGLTGMVFFGGLVVRKWGQVQFPWGNSVSVGKMWQGVESLVQRGRTLTTAVLTEPSNRAQQVRMDWLGPQGELSKEEITAMIAETMKLARELRGEMPQSLVAKGSSQETPEISQLLGWVSPGEEMEERVGDIEEFVGEVRRDINYERVVVIGEKGRIYEEAIATIIGERTVYPEVSVLESTRPEALREIESNLEETLFVVSSPGPVYEYLYRKLVEFYEARGISSEEIASRVGRHFVLMAEAKTLFAKQARERSLRTFNVPEGLNGSYSIFDYQGLVALALAGVDIEGLVESGIKGMESCREEKLEENPGAQLAVFQEVMRRTGRNQIGLILPEGLERFAEWWQERVSLLGIENNQIIPVAEEELASPERYGENTAFIAVGFDGTLKSARPVFGWSPFRVTGKLREAGYPVFEIPLRGEEGIGGLFAIVEFATALTAYLGVSSESLTNRHRKRCPTSSGRSPFRVTKKGEPLSEYPFRLASSSGNETQVIAVDLAALLKMKVDREPTHSGMGTKVTVSPNGLGAFQVMGRIIEEAEKQGNLQKFNFAFICSEKGVTKEAIERMLRDFMCENGLSLEVVARIVENNLIIDEETLKKEGGMVGISRSPKISAEAVFSIITERLLGKTNGNGIKVNIITDNAERWEIEARRRKDIVKRILWVVLNPAEKGQVLSTAEGLVIAVEGKVPKWLIDFIKKNYPGEAEMLLPKISRDGMIILPAAPVDDEYLEKIRAQEKEYEIQA